MLFGPGAHAIERLKVGFVVAVGKVESAHVHAGLEQRLEFSRFRGGGAERGDDFGSQVFPQG